MEIIMGILIPFFGTALGSAVALFMGSSLNHNVEKLLLGFASGVMLAASFWSLILPSLEMSKEQGGIEWLPAAVGFLSGAIFLFLLDKLISYLHPYEKKQLSQKPSCEKTMMLLIAVTLHNIPEGMAVGVAFAGVLYGSVGIKIASAVSLAIGIAIQNIPEGTIVSMPLRSVGVSRGKAFFIGIMSGIVEPAAAILTILFSQIVVLVLPYLLSFAAGAMISVVMTELVPESQTEEKSAFAAMGVAVGFVLMMILDVALG